MDAALAGAALLMGLAGSPHCVSMCGAACSALTAGRSSGPASLGLQGGRLLSYALAGAVVASSVSVLGRWGGALAWLRPFWLLVHLGAFGLGLYLLWRGRQPAWLERLGVGRNGAVISLPVASLGKGSVSWSQPTRATLAGLAWIAWPCGLLQSALVVAALASGPLGGAAVMASFAIGSGLGLWLGPLLLWRLLRLGPVNEGRGFAWAVRLAGLGLFLSSGWALAHGLWQQIEPFCR